LLNQISFDTILPVTLSKIEWRIKKNDVSRVFTKSVKELQCITAKDIALR